jgi:Xaa-Pro aminopeptidase
MSNTCQTRLANLRQVMADTGTDLVALGPSSHMVWLAGVNPHGDERPVMLLVSQHYAGFLMPALNADSVRQHSDLPFHTWRDDTGPDAALAALIRDCGAARAGVSVVLDETMRADFALRLLAALPECEHRFTENTVSLLRAAKDISEYDALLASARLNDIAAMAGFDALRIGISEKEIADVIGKVYAAHGAAREFTSVAFGANGAFPHHHTGDTRLTNDIAVQIDTGARHMGYPSDMTRCGWFGTPTDEYRNIFNVVEDAVQAALKASEPGVIACEVDAAARGVITGAGYGDMFKHRTGHGMGIDIHETPYIAGNSEQTLNVGNVYSIEPGIYLAGRFGVRLEDIVILRKNGPEILSGLDRSMILRG